jgi:hypothetical protein
VKRKSPKEENSRPVQQHSSMGNLLNVLKKDGAKTDVATFVDFESASRQPASGRSGGFMPPQIWPSFFFSFF